MVYNNVSRNDRVLKKQKQHFIFTSNNVSYRVKMLNQATSIDRANWVETAVVPTMNRLHLD